MGRVRALLADAGERASVRAHLSRLFRKLPAVARRDRQITHLLKQQGKHRREIAAPRREMKRSERAATELTQRLLRSERRLQVARELVKRTEYPTFELMLTHYRAHIRRATALGATKTEPVLEIPRKLRNISLAQSHGMSVPQIYQVWDSLDEIQLTGMPDMFVL